MTWLNYSNPYLSPFQEMQRWKTHPAIAAILEGRQARVLRRARDQRRRLQSVPKLVFPGGALIGDSAGFLNVPRIKGTHTAMKSGMMAAEAACRRGPCRSARRDELAAYPEAFEQSWVKKELSVVRNVAAAGREVRRAARHGARRAINMWLEQLGHQDALHDEAPPRPQEPVAQGSWSSRSPIPSPTAC